ncbi:MAG: M18 family aminopeptidase [Clostridia bacterium]|nr:M18 family aminopeptidase [Clostridia bacterium]
MTIQNLFSFLDKSPSAYHAVSEIETILQENGFIKLNDNPSSPLLFGKNYYLTRNGSSVIAFRLPNETPKGIMIAASHSDSPTFKIKPNAESEALGEYVKLNTERYGGMIIPSWFDRPLSIAGRVAISTEFGIETRLVNLDSDLAVIPNVAIHMNRKINDGYAYNPAVDTMPLVASLSSGKHLTDLVAQAAHTTPDSILGHDLFLYCRQKATLIGADNSFFLAPRIDNLECAHATLGGFLEASIGHSIAMYALFDNEETGSETKQGAASDFLTVVINRIVKAFQLDADSLLNNSMMLSADNAHACHPNHPELSDRQNAPHMNCGIVIKYNASQRYTTDGVSAALFKSICTKANVKTQVFANRSDMAGGSTLGSIASTRVSMKTVDIGLAQLAMHSACETAGVEDYLALTKASTIFFSTTLETNGDAVRIEYAV